jgi:hypothetical protein
MLRIIERIHIGIVDPLNLARFRHDHVNTKTTEHAALNGEPCAEQGHSPETPRLHLRGNAGNYVDQRQWGNCGQFSGADMRSDCDDRAYLGATSRQAGDEACQITRKPGTVVGFDEGAYLVHVGMCDEQPCRFSSCRMGGEEPTIVIDGCTRPQTADQAEASSLSAGRAHVNGTLPT